MAKNIRKGKEGEWMAAAFLEARNGRILEYNYRSGRGEIDLIVLLNETILFVEVKRRKNALYGFPETFVRAEKAGLIRKTAEDYILQQNWQGRIRFDIISILGEKIEWFEDAF